MSLETKDKVDDGNTAFPTTFDAWQSGFGGMSLRDYFAAKAMAAIANDVVGGRFPVVQGNLDAIAFTAYAMADAMLKARSN